jgi:hypothetical protein
MRTCRQSRNRNHRGRHRRVRHLIGEREARHASAAHARRKRPAHTAWRSSVPEPQWPSGGAGEAGQAFRSWRVRVAQLIAPTATRQTARLTGDHGRAVGVSRGENQTVTGRQRCARPDGQPDVVGVNSEAHKHPRQCRARRPTCGNRFMWSPMECHEHAAGEPGAVLTGTMGRACPRPRARGCQPGGQSRR